MAGKLEFLNTLCAVIDDRVENPEQSGYTTGLIKAGPKRIAQKVGEEGVEVALSAVSGDRSELIEETADLLFHLLVLLRTNDIAFTEVVNRLEQRHMNQDS